MSDMTEDDFEVLVGQWPAAQVGQSDITLATVYRRSQQGQAFSVHGVAQLPGEKLSQHGEALVDAVVDFGWFPVLWLISEIERLVTFKTYQSIIMMNYKGVAATALAVSDVVLFAFSSFGIFVLIAHKYLSLEVFRLLMKVGVSIVRMMVRWLW